MATNLLLIQHLKWNNNQSWYHLLPPSKVYCTFPLSSSSHQDCVCCSKHVNFPHGVFMHMLQKANQLPRHIIFIQILVSWAKCSNKAILIFVIFTFLQNFLFPKRCSKKCTIFSLCAKDSVQVANQTKLEFAHDLSKVLQVFVRVCFGVTLSRIRPPSIALFLGCVEMLLVVVIKSCLILFPNSTFSRRLQTKDKEFCATATHENVYILFFKPSKPGYIGPL